MSRTSVYAEAIETGSADFGRKKSHYSGDLERASLLAGLAEQDARLDAALEGLQGIDLDAWRVAFFGNSFDFSRYSYVLVQHEALHHGLWSACARLAGFDTPLSWRVNWEL